MRRATLAIFAAALTAAAASSQRPLPVVTLPASSPLRVIVTGDAGTGNPHVHNGIRAVVSKRHVDGIVLVGDNVYPCGVESITDPQWHNMTVNFGDIGVPIYPVLGNHDYGDPSPHHTSHCGHPSPQAQVDATGHIAHWIFPARRFELRSPLAEFVMIDTQPIASAWTTPFLGSGTASSELSAIDATLHAPFAGWKIVVGHHTVYSSGVHGKPNDFYTHNLRAALLPMFDRDGVDLYICGHDHDTELIGSLQHKRGRTEYLVAGNGAYSQPLTPRGTDEPPTIFPSFPAKPLVGFTLLEITRDRMDVTFYDGTGVARSPTFTIQRVNG